MEYQRRFPKPFALFSVVVGGLQQLTQNSDDLQDTATVLVLLSSSFFEMDSTQGLRLQSLDESWLVKV